MEFTYNKCIVKSIQGVVVAMACCQYNLYQIIFTKVHRIYVVHLVQSLQYQKTFELRLLNFGILGLDA
jgi:hypothetical protein